VPRSARLRAKRYGEVSPEPLAQAETRREGPYNRSMHVVMILLRVKPELLDDFERVLLHNARESVAKDPGCLRFDVSQDVDDPTRWMLQEVYDRPEAHAVHRQSPHFLAFQAVADLAVVEKAVLKGVGKHVP
jgi:autoinducer 2-degrading protein